VRLQFFEFSFFFTRNEKTNEHIRSGTSSLLTEAELKLLQTLVYQECGMHFRRAPHPFSSGPAAAPPEGVPVDSFYSYYRLLISPQGKDELAKLLENLTVNETSFFRHKAQLDLFQKTVLEEMFKHKSSRREYSIRIWSAGCSTGQEAYTLAMLVTDALAYYYLRNPLPDGLALAQAAGAAAVAGGNSGQRHCLFRAAARAGRRLQREPDVDGRLQLPPALLRQGGRTLCHQEGR
jgi:hypothetical protein